jgi:hypothetical protein
MLSPSLDGTYVEIMIINATLASDFLWYYAPLVIICTPRQGVNIPLHSN